MSCPHCNAPLAVDARFCPSCGKAMVSTETTADVSGPLRAQRDLVGRDIAGRFRIFAKLGEGGMGAVYKGEQISLKRACAVKVLRNELSANQQLLRRFQAEATAVAQLDHPNTVKVYDFGQDTDGSLFIAMEFIEGQALRAVLTAAGPLPPARSFHIALQVAASLIDAHAHSIVHRDLKPDNVMLQNKGRQKDIVRVLDFGIAKLRDDSRQTQAAMTQAGDMLGTPQYMAPEQIRGDAIDGRTDVYALGCMLYEMLTARLPYEAPTIMAMLSKHLTENPVPPSQRRPDLGLSPAIDQVVLAAMAKNPNERPATMELYAEMLAGVMATLPQDPAYQASAAMSAAIAPKSVMQPAVQAPSQISSSLGTPQPYAPPPATPQPFPQMPTPTPTPQPGYGQAAPYTPGYAAQPYAPPPIAPTAYVQREEPKKSSKLPLFMVLGALALGGAGVGVWAATRGSDSPKQDDYKAKLDDHDHASDVPEHKDDHHDTPAPPPHHDDTPDTPPSNGPDPWASSGDPSMAPMPHPRPQAPPPSRPSHPNAPNPPPEARASHQYSCDQLAAKTIQLVNADLQEKMKQMTPEQLQQVAAQYQKSVAEAYKKIVDTCTSNNWSDASRQCVMDATTLAAATKCQ